MAKMRVPKKKMGMGNILKKNWQLYVLILPAVIYFFVFNYMPLYGIQIAFKDYKAVDGIAGSAWVGWKNFTDFFHAYYFKRLLLNTLLLNIYYLLWSFPVPLILAILLNRIRGDKTKRTIQTCIYIPYFISTVVLAGMLYIFLSPSAGIFNVLREAFGLKAIDFMSKPEAFRSIYIASGVWQSAGWGTILYIASLSGVDQELYEAAEIDGANGIQKFFYVTLPLMCPSVKIVVVTGLIGGMKVFDIIYSMTSGGPGDATQTVMTVMMKKGISEGFYSTGAAFGVCFFIIVLVISAVVTKLMGKWSDAIQ